MALNSEKSLVPAACVVCHFAPAAAVLHVFRQNERYTSRRNFAYVCAGCRPLADSVVDTMISEDSSLRVTVHPLGMISLVPALT